MNDPATLFTFCSGCRLFTGHHQRTIDTHIDHHGGRRQEQRKSKRRRERSVFARTDQLRRSASANEDVLGLQVTTEYFFRFDFVKVKSRLQRKNNRTSNERYQHPRTIRCAVAVENNARDRYLTELGVASPPHFSLVGSQSPRLFPPCTTRGARAASGGGGDPRRRRK